MTTQPRQFKICQTLAKTNSENRCYAISNATVKVPNERAILMKKSICEKKRLKITHLTDRKCNHRTCEKKRR